MKKISITAVCLAFTLALSACAGTNNQNAQANNGSGQGQGFGNRAISLPLQLTVGIFKLESTRQAVDAKQAALLIPLWQLFDQLETSSSSAPEEVSAVTDQIKATLTTGQIDAIDAMKLTNRDAFTMLQQQGIIQGGGFGFSGTPNPNRTPGAGGGGFAGGGFPGGGGGGGGFQGGGGGGQNLNPNQIATVQARRAQGGSSNRLPAGVVDALIRLLQAKITPAFTPTPTATSTQSPAIESTDTPAPSPTP